MEFKTLSQLIQRRSVLKTQGVTFIQRSDQASFVSYHDLYSQALQALGFLQSSAVKQKNEVLIVTDDQQSFITIFWACILGGFIPVPVAVGTTDDQRSKIFRIFQRMNDPWLLCTADLSTKISDDASRLGFGTMINQITSRLIDENIAISFESEGRPAEITEEDVALVQFSSGSTGNPKGVVLTHKNLLCNVHAISTASKYTAEDSTLSWMPLTHDMGLIGFHINPIYSGINQFLIPTNLFVRKPSIWLEKASTHAVTVLCSPNFGYKYVLKYFKENKAPELDLTAIRIIYNGAEPISLELCREFSKTFARVGLKENSIRPVYGLAEASLAVTISEPSTPVRHIAVDRRKILVGEKVSLEHGSDLLHLVCVGKAIRGCEIRVVDGDNHTLADGHIGHLQIRGGNVSNGYYNDGHQTSITHTSDGWVNTGDIGLIMRGDLYISGRAKDIIFVNGANYYSHDLERIAEAVDGVELNKIIVTGFTDTVTQTEAVVAFVLHRASILSFKKIELDVKTHLLKASGIEITAVVPVRDIPRTTSGKLQRYKLRDQYIKGDFDHLIAELGILKEPSTHDDEFITTSVEQVLRDSWRSVSGFNTSSLSDILSEIRSNSLLSAKFAASIEVQLNVDIGLDVLYTIDSLADFIRIVEQRKSAGIVKAIHVPSVETETRLSSAQRRLLNIWRADRTSTAYNIPIALKIGERLDATLLTQSISKVLGRHEALRTNFTEAPEEKFVIRESTGVDLKVISCAEHEVDEILTSLVEPFDLEAGPVCRFAIINTLEYQLLFLDFHHVNADGVSVQNFLKELFDQYSGVAITTSLSQYRDYIAYEYSLDKVKIALQRNFWAERLHRLNTVSLPTDFPRSAVFRSTGHKISFDLSREIVSEIKQISNDKRVSLFVVMSAIYSIFLSKIAGTKDVTFGVPVANRPHSSFQGTLGMFVNNMPIRSTVDPSMTFIEFLEILSKDIRVSLSNMDLPFDEIIASVNIEKDASRNVLFDSMLLFDNLLIPTSLGRLKVTRHFFDPGTAKYDLSLEIITGPGDWTYNIEYADSAFTVETITRWGRYFRNLVAAILEAPTTSIAKLSLIDEIYRVLLKDSFNLTTAEAPRGTIDQLFTATAQKFPGRVAAQTETYSVTYGELDMLSSSFASYLVEIGVTGTSHVAVLMERSANLLVGILGVMKSGACYVPISVELPQDRISFMISHSECNVIVVDGKPDENIRKSFPGVYFVDIGSDNWRSYSSYFASRSFPEGQAYIIYTSGTTGQPKGVVITNYSLVNYVSWAKDIYMEGEQLNFAFFTSISIDLTVTSLFVPLISGNRIIVYGEAPAAEIAMRLLTDNRVNVIKCTPSHLRLFQSVPATSGSVLRKLIVGGEQLTQSLALSIYKNFNGRLDIFNEYGPTEATVGCMICRFDPESKREAVAIGVPIQNMEIYILDSNLEISPVGIPGEIFIAGAGLSTGYFNDVDLTEEKFINHQGLKRRLYRTGDVAKYLDENSIEYIGRADRQVKVNGHRIELQEVENKISGIAGIDDAIVLIKRTGSNEYLVAYYTSTEDIGSSYITEFLAERLPYYMIPATCIHIDQFPLTINGKVDHKKLMAIPVPEESTSQTEVTHEESVLLSVWRNVFSDDSIRISDNFYDIGGDSIKAVQIASKLSQLGYRVDVRSIMTYHTIPAICKQMQGRSELIVPEQSILNGSRRPTPIENWFLEHKFANIDFYNQSILLSFRKDINITAIRSSLRDIVLHHDGLRTIYDEANNRFVYGVPALCDGLEVAELDLPALKDNNVSFIEFCRQVKSRMDVRKGAMVSAGVVRTLEQHFFLLSIHHLVTDGISWRVILEDFYNLYNAYDVNGKYSLPLKSSSLIDWLSLCEKRSTGKLNVSPKNTFELPFDKETEDWRSTNCRSVTSTLDKERTHLIYKASRLFPEAEVIAVLNLAVGRALQDWTGANEFEIEQESHGRQLDGIDVGRTVAWFTKLYNIHLKLTDLSIEADLQSINRSIRESLNSGHHFASNSLPEIRLNYLGRFEKEFDNSLFVLSNIDHGADSDPANDMTAKLELIFMTVGDALNVRVNFNQEAHYHSTITRFLDSIVRHIDGIVTELIDSHNDKTPQEFSAQLSKEELDNLFG